MSEEINDIEPIAVPEERVLTDFEKTQVEDGWNPEGEKTAEEWASNTGFVEKIKKQSKQLKTLNRTIDQLKIFMEKQEKLAYDRAVADLNAQREQAIAEGDKREVKRLDQEVEAMRPPSKEAIDFQERNEAWLRSPKPLEMKMTAFARQRDIDLMQYGLSPAEHMKVLEEHIHAEFPQYFKTEEESEEIPVKKSATVASGKGGNISGDVGGKKKLTYNDLDPAQKKVANDFKNAGIMTIQQYIDAITKAGESR